MQSTLQEGTEDSTWNQLSPLLDEALSRLGRKDRDAVMLRFFKGRNVREMAAALEISEAAAQRRVLRAMEKLRKFFTKRGVSSTTTIIAEKISAHSIQAAPIALAKSVAVIAISKGAMSSASTLTLIKGALKIMAWTKAKTAIVVGIGVLLAAGTAEVTFKKIAARKIADPLSLNESFWALDIRTLIKAPQVVALRPSTTPTRAGTVSTETRMLARNVPLNSLMYYAYAPNNIYYQFHHQYRTVLTPGIADGKFDLLLTLNDHPQEALQAEIKKQLGLVAHFETRETDAILLRCSNPAAPRLTPSQGNGSTRLGRGKFDFTNQPVFALTDFLEIHFGKLVIDETGLTQHYSGTLKWNPQPDKAAEQKEIQTAFLQQLGLEVVDGRESTDMLVVEKAP
jgi:uncharacterized protein (TIGR03435 family)